MTVPALSAVVYKARKALPKPAVGTVRLRVDPQPATRAEITADVSGDPLASVTMSVKVGRGDWQPLGTATRAPYRIFHDLAGLEAGTALTYQAVVGGVTTTTRARVGTPSTGPARDHAVVHYQRPAGDYAGWGVRINGQLVPFTGEDAYGRFASVKLGRGPAEFAVTDGTATDGPTRTIDPARTGEIWLRQGDPAIHPSDAAASRTVTVHYGRNEPGWGLHLSGDGLAAGHRHRLGQPAPAGRLRQLRAVLAGAARRPGQARRLRHPQGRDPRTGPDGTADRGR